MATFHFFTLLQGTDPSAMRSHYAPMSFRNQTEAHVFAIRAAFVALKNGATKVEVSVKRRMTDAPLFNVVREG